MCYCVAFFYNDCVAVGDNEDYCAKYSDMIIPVRCFTCGKVLADRYQAYMDLVRSGHPEDRALDAVDLKRWCCRRMLLTHVDFSDQLLKYNPADNAGRGLTL